MDCCSQCPHPNDCLKVGACLDDINAPVIAKNQVPRLMLPQQARNFEAALRTGRPLLHLIGGGKFGPPIASAPKYRLHCAEYPIWGAEMKSLARRNLISLRAAAKRNGTHCKRGHLLPLEPNCSDGRKRYRRCPQCLAAADKRGYMPSAEVIANVKELLLENKSIRSFTNSSKGDCYLLRHSSFTLLRKNSTEIERLASQRIEVARRRSAILRRGVIAAKEIFTAVNAAVSHQLPRHIRDDVVGDVIHDVLAGVVGFHEISAAVKKRTSKAYQEVYRHASLDAPRWRDGKTPYVETLSQEQGLWD
jgi:hypothetical protein